MWPHGCSGRRRARPPARLGDLTSFGAAPRSPPVPSGPSGALHTSGAWCARGRRPAREIATREPAARKCRSRGPPWPCHRPPAPRPGPATAHLHRGPPASRPRRELRSVRRLEASPGPEAISAISHVIPLRLVQTLNLHRWNCNVFVWSRKVTVGNYVRLWSVLALLPLSVPQPGLGLAARPCPPVPSCGVRVAERKLCSG